MQARPLTRAATNTHTVTEKNDVYYLPESYWYLIERADCVFNPELFQPLIIDNKDMR